MEEPTSRTGVWIVGAFGSLATTVIVGARAIARGLARSVGLVSDDPAFSHLDLLRLGDLEFGGHEIRRDTASNAAASIAAENGSLSPAWLTELKPDLDAVTARVRPGTAVGGGRAIAELADGWATSDRRGRDCVERLTADLESFRRSCGLSRVIVVNLSSTEPGSGTTEPDSDLAAFERRLDSGPVEGIRPGALYAYAAIKAGAAYVNFTASTSCLSPAIVQFAQKRRLPYMGSDGKTGETLVKSALAPLFRMRRLEVMSWVGYNVLGNRDGRVLAIDENKASKLGSKDVVVPSILGYPLRTQVGIDFVESLGDSKVAWDFIHFRGFLGHPMSMQFTWQGCDSILAAPLVLDLARFADLALRRGESGAMVQLASFFKNPLETSEHDLSRQYERLLHYAGTPPRSA